MSSTTSRSWIHSHTIALCLVTGALAAFGCASDSGQEAPAPTQVDPDARQLPADPSFACPSVSARLSDDLMLSELSDDEIGCYCDWSTSVTAGGYNVTLNCPPGAAFHTSESRAQCVGEARDATRSCDVPAQAAVDCVLEQVDDPCNTLQNLLSEACQPLLTCGS
jgi:hypothetical protein